MACELANEKRSRDGQSNRIGGGAPSDKRVVKEKNFKKTRGLEGDLQEIRRWGGNQEELPFMGIVSLKSEPDLDLGILGVRT